MAGLEDIPSYIFGGTSGTPSYEELLRRRQVAVANAMRGRKAPTTLGEGMTYLGEAIGDRIEGGRLSEAERLLAAKEAADRKAAPGGGYVPGAATAAPPAAGAAVPFSGVGAGNLSGAGVRDRIAALVQDQEDGAPQEVAQANPTWSVAEAPPTTPTPGGLSDLVERRRNAIGGIESGGRGDPYTVLGAVTPSGDRAYGRYQVMGANIPEWTQAALGQRLTPRDFLVSKEAQDTVFDRRFGEYANKYGDEGAARAWYAGERGMRNPNATDQHGRLTVAGYGQDYLNRLGGGGAGAAPGPAPVRVASLGGAGGTMSDASPPEAVSLAALSEPIATPATLAPPAADENPPTPSDIKPMPVRTTRVAQAGPGIIPGSVAGLPGLPAAGVLAAPVAGPAEAAPGAPPSLRPMPEASEQVMAHPGAEPVRPNPLGPSKPQQYWKQFIDNPHVSPQMQAHAKREYDAEEMYRKTLQEAQTNDYIDRREKWQQKIDAYDKFQRETNDRRIDQSVKLHGLEKTRQDLEEGYYKTGIPREQARVKADLDIDQARQSIKKSEQELAAGKAPAHVTVDDKLLIWDQDSKTFKPRPPDPKAEGRPDIKLSETQAKTFDNLQKADIAYEQYKRIPDVDKVLADGLRDELAGKIPFFGNAALSSRYRRARNAALNFVTAHLRETSGAVIAPSEEASTIANMFPILGDDGAVIKQKKQIQEGVVTGMRLKLGRAGDLADYAAAERQKADAIEQAKIDAEMRGVPKVIGKIYKEGNKRRYWTGTRWEDD